MDQKILVFAGKKQAGKSSAANFVTGYLLSQLGRRGFPFCPKKFDIDEDGQLIVDTETIDIDGNTQLSNGILNLRRRDEEFVTWAMNIMWPHVKIYSFADTLKWIAINVFGVPDNLVYGNEEDKSQSTHIKWKDMSAFLVPIKINALKRSGLYDQNMSVRAFLQYFGTNVCRKIYNDCWVNNCFKNIIEEGAELAIIDDARFANEIKTSKKMNAKVIKLERFVDKDSHDSEKELDKISTRYYDLQIDNQYMTIKEKNQAILDAMYDWEWFNSHISLEQ